MTQITTAVAVLIAVLPVLASAVTLDDIRFRAAFDQTLEAELAAGSATATKVDGTVRFEPGRFEDALVAGESGAVPEYRIESNLDVKQGALSLWFNPVNWQPGERRSHVFLRFLYGSVFRLFIDESGMLVFEVGPDLVERRRVAAAITHLRQGEWAQIVVTWSVQTQELRLYVNGELGSITACDDRFLPLVVTGSFQVGDMVRARGRESERVTLLDDLTIYARPLQPGEFGRLDAALSDRRAAAYEPPLLSVRRALQPFTIDGQLDEHETTNTTAFGNFLNVGDHALAALPTVARAGYTDEQLYFAVTSPILSGIDLTANCRNRDDQVWTDDAVQIYLAPPSGGYRYHFVCNSRGIIFDRRETVGIQHDPNWNGAWQVANRSSADTWTLEVAIGFADLGLEPPAGGEQWRVNVTRDRVTPQNLSCWPKLNAFADTDRHGFLRFSESGTAVSVARMGPILDERIRIQGRVHGAAAGLTARLQAARNGAILREWTAPEPVFDVQVSNGTPDTLDLRVLDAENLELFRQTVPLGQSRTTLTVTSQPIPSKGVCSITLREQDPAILQAEPTAVAELVRVGTVEPVRTVNFGQLSGGSASGTFEIAALAPGQYRLQCRVEQGGRTLDQLVVPFVKPAEPWRQVHVGSSEQPPPPWTPMQSRQLGTDVLEIECWNRTQRLQGPLPAWIRNGAAEPLAGPVRIAVHADGRSLPWTEVRIDDVHSTATEVRFDTSMRAEHLAARARTTMEFDGMMWCEITIEPRAGSATTALDGLDLVVPLKARFATLLHVPGDVYQTGKTGTGDDWSLDLSPKRFMVWIGNEDLGLTWFYERPDQFRYADRDRFVRLERDGDTMLLKVRYVTEPVTLSEPLILRFGLQATPVRSRPPGWRSWGEPRPIGNSIVIPWANEAIDRYGAGYPEATSPGYYTRFVADRRRYGRVAPYKVMLWHAIDSPEWQYNAADWDLGGGVNKYSDTRRFWWGGRVCGAAETFVDFITWKLQQHVHEHWLDGLYHDLQWSYVCNNANHGCAPGRRSIRGDRELNKRVYTMLKQFERPVIKIDHASNQIASAFNAFSDAFVSGEEMCAGSTEPEKPTYRVWDDYFRNMRIDYFKASGLMGRQWGVVPMMLLQMKSPGTAATEHIFAVLLAHDAIPTWDAWGKDVRFMANLWRLLAEFEIGHEALEFLPYWHETTPARITAFRPDGGGPIRPVQVDKYDPKPWQLLTESEARGASIYHLRGRRSLVVVFNYTEDDAAVVVQLDTQALGFEPGEARATDAYARLDWVPAEKPIELTVRNRNFRLIWVEAGAEFSAAEFPDETPLQFLAGTRPPLGQADTTGEQIVGDLWDQPFGEEDGFAILADDDAAVAVANGTDAGNLDTQGNLAVSVYGSETPTRTASHALWKFDLSAFQAISAATMVVDLRLDQNQNPQVAKQLQLARGTGQDWRSATVTWSDRPAPGPGISLPLDATAAQQWHSYRLDVTELVQDSAGQAVTLTMLPLRPDRGNTNYTLIARRRRHPDESQRQARLLVRGRRPDPARPPHPRGTEVAQVFTLERPTKLARVEVRMRYTGVRGPDTREPIQAKVVHVDSAGLPTNRTVIDAALFTRQWLNTAWHDAFYELKRGQILAPGRYALVLFKTPEEYGENHHAVLPTIAAADAGGTLATRIVPGGTWKRDSVRIAYAVYGYEAH